MHLINCIRSVSKVQKCNEVDSNFTLSHVRVVEATLLTLKNPGHSLLDIHKKSPGLSKKYLVAKITYRA